MIVSHRRPIWRLRASRPLGGQFSSLPAILLTFLLAGCAAGVLDPQGPVGGAEKTILLNSLGIMLAIVVPTIIATLLFAWWFRAGNKRAVYRPDWTFSGQLELVVWAIPAMVVVLIASSMSWRS